MQFLNLAAKHSLIKLGEPSSRLRYPNELSFESPLFVLKRVLVMLKGLFFADWPRRPRLSRDPVG